MLHTSDRQVLRWGDWRKKDNSPNKSSLHPQTWSYVSYVSTTLLCTKSYITLGWPVVEVPMNTLYLAVNVSYLFSAKYFPLNCWRHFNFTYKAKWRINQNTAFWRDTQPIITKTNLLSYKLEYLFSHPRYEGHHGHLPSYTKHSFLMTQAIVTCCLRLAGQTTSSLA